VPDGSLKRWPYAGRVIVVLAKPYSADELVEVLAAAA
jgi:hypothetical protein